jgi:hypothetical protein
VKVSVGASLFLAVGSQNPESDLMPLELRIVHVEFLQVSSIDVLQQRFSAEIMVRAMIWVARKSLI